ncbi:hypothetical protein V6Z12_D05G333200 [Gossypium hirsutum]
MREEEKTKENPSDKLFVRNTSGKSKCRLAMELQ